MATGAQIDDAEVGALEHHGHEVFADVVEVALHGADHGGEFRLDAGLGEQRLENAHAFLHRPRGNQHLWHEDLVVLEFLTNAGHSRHQPLLDNLERLESLLEERLGEKLGVIALAAFDGHREF